MSARPAARDPFAPDHGTPGARAEARGERSMRDAVARGQHSADQDVGPEDTRHRGTASVAAPTPPHSQSTLTTHAASAGASGGGGGFGRPAPAAGGPSDVEPPDDARQAIPGKPGEARGGPGSGLMVLSAGVDALYASAVGAPAPCHLATAQKRKADAAAEEQAVVWEPKGAGRAFLVRPHGWRGFPIWLTSPAMDVCMGGGRALPALYLWLQAPFIHQVGVEVAVEEAERVRMAWSASPSGSPTPTGSGRARTAGRPSSLPHPGHHRWAPRSTRPGSTCMWTPRAGSRPGRISPASCAAPSAAPSSKGRGSSTAAVAGWRASCSGAVRSPPKTLELASRGETWPHAIWEGVDPERHVWRVELQFRRPALKSFRLKTVADVLAAREELWDYGMRWISLRVSNGDTNRSRWPEASAWRALRETAMGSPRSELVRERREAASKLRLLRGFVGYATSLAACDKEPDLVEVLRDVPEVSAYLARKGLTFEDVVTVKRDQRLAL